MKEGNVRGKKKPTVSNCVDAEELKILSKNVINLANVDCLLIYGGLNSNAVSPITNCKWLIHIV